MENKGPHMQLEPYVDLTFSLCSPYMKFATIDLIGSDELPMATPTFPSMDAVQTWKVPPPDAFDGSEDDFDEFEFKLKGYMSSSDRR